MKKILFILAFALVAIGASAQLVPVAPDYTIPANGGSAGIYNATAATVAAATSYVFKVNALAPYYYAYEIELDDNTGSNTATFVISGGMTGRNDFKTITSVSYTGAGTDTTIIGAVSTAVPYNYIKFTVTPSDTIWVKEYLFKAAPIAK